MSVGVLFAGTMLVCCLGLISGGPADEDQNRYKLSLLVQVRYKPVRLIEQYVV